jgi:tetratricopeptide (TPR) repeat protein
MAQEGDREPRFDRPRRRLESWKEIATYLERDVRTVQRWERRDGLPVHRLQHAKRGSVFAYLSELDAWRESRDTAPVARREARNAPTAAGLSTASLLRATMAFLVVVLLLLQRPAEKVDTTAAHPVAPEVYESYLRGLLHLERGDRISVEKGVRYLEATVAADRSFAPAYARLAAAYQLLGSTGTGVSPVSDVQPKAAALAKKALDLDPHLSAAHSGLAFAYQQEWRWADAEVEYQRALKLDPNDATTHGLFAGLLVWRGRTQEGLEHARRARELDPVTVDRTVRLGWLLYHARRYDEAIRELQTVVQVQPDHKTALWFLGFAMIDSSRPADAIAPLERLTILWDRNPAALGLLARALGRAARREDALAIVDELKRRERTGYVPPAPFVHAYIGLGDREQAFAALERAYRERSNILQFLKTHPLYDPLRDDSRFTDLLHRVGLD